MTYKNILQMSFSISDNTPDATISFIQCFFKAIFKTPSTCVTAHWVPTVANIAYQFFCLYQNPLQASADINAPSQYCHGFFSEINLQLRPSDKVPMGRVTKTRCRKTGENNVQNRDRMKPQSLYSWKSRVITNNLHRVHSLMMRYEYGQQPQHTRPQMHARHEKLQHQNGLRLTLH